MNLDTHADPVTIRIIANDGGNPAGRLDISAQQALRDRILEAYAEYDRTSIAEA